MKTIKYLPLFIFQKGFGNKEGVEPYETISYANGPGFNEHRATNNSTNPRYNTWKRVEDLDRSSPVYRHLATIPMGDETHGGKCYLELTQTNYRCDYNLLNFCIGEDVPVYAKGPNANLVQGAMEQSFIAYIMSYSACIGPAAKYNNACKYQTSASSSIQAQTALKNKNSLFLAVLLALVAKLM